MWVRASLFRRFTDTNVHGAGSVKVWKRATKYPWIQSLYYSCGSASSPDEEVSGAARWRGC